MPTPTESRLEWARELPLRGEGGGSLKRIPKHGQELKRAPPSVGLLCEVGGDALIEYATGMEFSVHKAL